VKEIVETDTASRVKGLEREEEGRERGGTKELVRFCITALLFRITSTASLITECTWRTRLSEIRMKVSLSASSIRGCTGGGGAAERGFCQILVYLSLPYNRVVNAMRTLPAPCLYYYPL
jgi:hypothetical protein